MFNVNLIMSIVVYRRVSNVNGKMFEMIIWDYYKFMIRDMNYGFMCGV